MFTVPKMERPAGTHIQKKLEVTGLEEKKKKAWKTPWFKALQNVSLYSV